MHKLDPDMQIREYYLGNEKTPLLVVDNFIEDAESLIEYAVEKRFEASHRYYPGIRFEATKEYRRLFVEELSTQVLEFFNISGTRLSYTMCHYSLVTTPPEKLTLLQRIPHFDSLEPNGLATVHYLFKQPLGGTAFYRHKKTGFEYIDEERKLEYFRSLESENDGPNMPGAEYINGDTPLFEQVGKQEGVFNRMLVYRRNSLHSGCISKDFVPDPNPATGRLSINSFIDVV